jgi:hypothetical protein
VAWSCGIADLGYGTDVARLRDIQVEQLPQQGGVLIATSAAS